ncbi:hypothetical protein A7D16_16280 [Xanthomonas nasturtii]|uniref:Uncharacterized protein n=1 Tax=Xanthomonas nasturtii TaxID=1843581 RepID=A0A3E1KJV1_9XANT|nr:hypothetical protein A7D16_16280 [Xanthomonas nasturtii]RFF39033.1 hypothetical protein DZD52_10605 [Xanthomonas nasturtii]
MIKLLALSVRIVHQAIVNVRDQSDAIGNMGVAVIFDAYGILPNAPGYRVPRNIKVCCMDKLRAHVALAVPLTIPV